jgi:hypothetical protein
MHFLRLAAHAKRNVEARYHAAETLRLDPGFSIEKFMTREAFKRDADRQHMIEGPSNAGLAG